MAEPYLEFYTDERGERRARVRAGNHEILVVASEGYKSRDDLLVALELTRRALNAERNKNPAYKAETNRVMARRERKRLNTADLSHPALFGALDAFSRNTLLD